MKHNNENERKTLVITKSIVEGLHYWAAAPAQVDFLRYPHRHAFHVRCWFEVGHNDREIEIFMQQWLVEDFLYTKFGKPCEFGGMSCEAIAHLIMTEFKAAQVEVLEDGEGGALVRIEH